jgi:hypothetical protein
MAQTGEAVPAGGLDRYQVENAIVYKVVINPAESSRLPPDRADAGMVREISREPLALRLKLW